MGPRFKELGIYTWFGYMRPFETRLQLIKEAGFDSICSWWGDDFILLDQKKEDHVELSARYGLSIAHAHLPYAGLDALWQDSLPGYDLAEIHKREIKNASSCGIKTLVMHPYEDVKILKAGDYNVFIKHLHSLADTAFHSQIQLALENLKEFDLLDKLMQEFSDNPFVGFCFDSGHAHITNPNDFSFLAKYPDKLFALHLHDNDGIRDLHLLPGLGTIDWKKLVLALQATNFSGPLMLEASFPFDYSKENSNEAYQEPSLAPEVFLSDAISACRKLTEYIL